MLVWVLLCFFIILLVIIYAAVNWFRLQSFTVGSKRVVLIGLIAVHLRLVMGILIWLVSPMGFLSNIGGTAMKDKVSRFYFMEHRVMMLLAFVLVTMGHTKAKRGAAHQYKIITVYYLAGYLLILACLPWLL